MKFFAKILIGVAVAAVAALITVWLTGDDHAALPLFFAFCGATVTTALLVSLPALNASAPTQKSRQENRRSPGPATAKSSAAEGPREHGQVKWFNVSKGFGFITKDDGEEIFVHFRSIRDGGRRGLRDGQRVSFIVANSDKGPQAEDVEGLE